MKVVVIPAYQPDELLVGLVQELRQREFAVLVVNDGSDAACDAVFDEVATQAAVIRSPKNEGKGAALKRGFAAVSEYYPECTHVITADADGQHKVEDICRVSEQLDTGDSFVLTMRRFDGKIPARSKFGNDLSRVVYTVMNGHYFDDNQSGLRGFSVDHLSWLQKVGGMKYDYEMNVLCYADKQGIRIVGLPIEAVYIDGNRSSHFNPVQDTIRIYRRLFSSLWPSLVGVVVLEALLMLGSILFGNEHCHFTVPTAVMLSALLTVLLYRVVEFRCIPYRDGPRSILAAIIRAAAYTGIAFSVRLSSLTMIPLFVTVNVVAIGVLTAEYYVHKARHRIMK